MQHVKLNHCSYSLVDGAGLRTFLSDPMHTLCSSGYTLSGISARRPIYFLNLHHPAYKLMGFLAKKVVLAAFLVVIHQTIIYSPIISKTYSYIFIFSGEETVSECSPSFHLLLDAAVSDNTHP